MNFSGKSFAFSKSGNIPDIVNVKPSHSPNSSSPFQHLKNTVNSGQIIDKNFYDNNDDNQYSPINKDSVGYGDDDDKDREENNLSFEQLKNELIIHKRKKKDSKKVKINEATDKVVKSVSIPTEAECTIRFVEEETAADTDDYWRMISLLEPVKQKAKTVVQLFLPSIHTLRKFLRVRTYMRSMHITKINSNTHVSIDFFLFYIHFYFFFYFNIGRQLRSSSRSVCGLLVEVSTLSNDISASAATSLLSVIA